MEQNSQMWVCPYCLSGLNVSDIRNELGKFYKIASIRNVPGMVANLDPKKIDSGYSNS